jgi:hypothetical protein
MTYLGHKYLNPIIEREDFFDSFKNSYATKSIQPKLIIKGLNLLDSCLDIEGDVIPGKSTLIITSKDVNELKTILPIINSKLAFFYIKERYPASSYNQGTTFTKDMINSLPMPEMSKTTLEQILNKTNDILTITKSDDYFHNDGEKTKVRLCIEQIDGMVYKLYGLTDEEIKIIEAKT